MKNKDSSELSNIPPKKKESSNIKKKKELPEISNILKEIKTINNNKKNKINKILNIKNNYHIDFYKNGDNKFMGLYNNNNLVIAGNYNFYGIYQPYTKIWMWASSIPNINKKQILQINKLKLLNYKFESYTHPKLFFYYQLLTNDMLLIDNELMLEWINELLIYITDDLYYFNPVNSNGNIQFLTLTDIKEKYI